MAVLEDDLHEVQLDVGGQLAFGATVWALAFDPGCGTERDLVLESRRARRLGYRWQPDEDLGPRPAGGPRERGSSDRDHRPTFGRRKAPPPAGISWPKNA